MRLQKYLSQCGLCSRREAEEWIRAGRITINGRIASLGESADPLTDVVCADGEPITPKARPTYVMLHKPRGYVTSLRDERGRPTVADLVADAGERLFPVGRLDLQSEGLLIMTDDGEAAQRLAHPSHGVEKTYRVWVHGADAGSAAERFRRGIVWDGVAYAPAQVEILRCSRERSVLEITISEGKNREIRNMCAAVGLRVEKLMRIRQGRLELGDLPCGRWRRLTEEEIRWLKELS